MKYSGNYETDCKPRFLAEDMYSFVLDGQSLFEFHLTICDGEMTMESLKEYLKSTTMDWTRKNDKGQNLLMQFAGSFGHSIAAHSALKHFLDKGIDLNEKDNEGKTVFDLSPNILFLRAGLKVDDKVIEGNKEKFRYEQWLLETNVTAYDALIEARRSEFREERTK